MDINSLPEMQKILKFVQNMEFRTTMFGGFRKNDVEENFAEAIRMYEDMTNSMVARYDQRIAELEANLTEVNTSDASSEDAERRIAQITSDYEQQIAQITADYEEKSERLKRSSEAINRAGQEMYAKVSEDAKKRVQEAETTARETVAAAQARADAILADARNHAEEAMAEHRKQLEADVNKTRGSLTDLRKENDDIKAVLAEVAESYTEMLRAVTEREAEMTERLERLYASMDRAIEVSASLSAVHVERHEDASTPVAAQVPDATSWNKWLNDVLSSVSEEGDAPDDPTTADHRRFALSIEDAFADDDLTDGEFSLQDDAPDAAKPATAAAEREKGGAKADPKGDARADGPKRGRAGKGSDAAKAGARKAVVDAEDASNVA